MAKCLDCGKQTKSKSGICRTCAQARRAQKEKDTNKFGAAVGSVWESMKARISEGGKQIGKD